MSLYIPNTTFALKVLSCIVLFAVPKSTALQPSSLFRSCRHMLTLLPDNEASETSRCLVKEDDVANKVLSSRRTFLGSLATGAAVSQLVMVDLACAVDNNNATDAVDWDSFDAQLLKAQFKAPTAVGPGGPDLDKALEDSAKRKNIDPRTHG